VRGIYGECSQEELCEEMGDAGQAAKQVPASAWSPGSSECKSHLGLFPPTVATELDCHSPPLRGSWLRATWEGHKLQAFLVPSLWVACSSCFKRI
jgi:hypothetical protein